MKTIKDVWNDRKLFLEYKAFSGLSVCKRVENRLPVFITGGIGDNIVAVKLIQCLHEKMDLEIYSHHPDAFNFFKTPDVPACLGPLMPNYDYYLTVNSVVKMERNPHFEGFRWIPHHNLNEAIRSFQCDDEKMQKIFQLHPLFDGFLTNFAVAGGYNRRTFPFCFINQIPPTETYIKPHLKVKGDYITIHNGYETKLKKQIKSKSTKNVPDEVFSSFIELFKVQYPHLKVYQVGGNTSEPIPGADRWFLPGHEPLMLKETFSILAESRVHVDIESGLVHAATALGTKCVVLFGPTPIDYFGYKENINLKSDGCLGNCFWTTNDWMKKCPIGHDEPKCMSSFDPGLILGKVNSVMYGQHSGT